MLMALKIRIRWGEFLNKLILALKRDFRILILEWNEGFRSNDWHGRIFVWIKKNSVVDWSMCRIALIRGRTILFYGFKMTIFYFIFVFKFVKIIECINQCRPKIILSLSGCHSDYPNFPKLSKFYLIFLSHSYQKQFTSHKRQAIIISLIIWILIGKNILIIIIMTEIHNWISISNLKFYIYI
jgi:hypothetical protein